MTLLEPDRDQIERFVTHLFRHAGVEGWVSVRAFFDDLKSFRIQPVPLQSGLSYLIDVAEDIARRAANNPKKIVFSPPLAAFSNPKHAREGDLHAGLCLSVECDQHPDEARETLEGILGPATVVVRSGGKWTDEAGQAHDKLHLHWRLSKPARDGALPELKRARELATRIVGGDTSNIPIVHPIRWPGSWHRKADPVLCTIAAEDSDAEIDLAAALKVLEAAAPAQPQGNGKGAASGKVRERNGLGLETGKFIDGRERHMTEILCAKLRDFCGEFGAAPSAEELCDYAWDAYEQSTSFSRPGRGKNEFLGKCRSTVRRFLDGQIKGFETLEKVVEAYELNRAAQEAIGGNPRPGPGPRNDIVTEDSAAVEFVEENVDKLRYCHSTGSWFQWDGNIWRREDTQLAFHWARLLARRLGENEDKKARGAIGKTAFASGVEKFAQRDRAMAVTVAYWDQDQWLLGTPAGTVDLRTGKLRPSDPTDGITKSTLVAPADTGRVLWMKFLGETTGGDAGLIRFLQQWLGYCLTGSTREHALIFLYGGGGNGKGVFLNTTARIFGDYAATAAMDTFAVSKNERHPTDLAMLRGARIVTASETEEGRAWAEARIKALTGGDKISARFMRQDFFEYYPQFKLTIIGNHKPVLRTVDDAMRRRINMIPFLLKPPVIDRQLEDKLLTEARGILQWMIDGCLDWQANGLIRPAVVQAATSAYFSEQDLFGHWIEECCDVALGRNPPIWGLSGSLFASWAEYCRKANEAPGTQKAFAGKMIQRSFEPYRVPGTGSRAFKFIRLKNAPPTEAGVTRDTL
jgi:putative DNA primase/helicase